LKCLEGLKGKSEGWRVWRVKMTFLEIRRIVFGRDRFDRKVILTLQTLHPSSQL
jgi:hypothetical protein